MLLYETAAVPVHVDMNPPIGQASEQYLMAELTRANGIIDLLEQTSPDVIRLTRLLRQNPSNDDRAIIELQLRSAFEAALYQGGVPPGMVPGLAQMQARCTVRGIRMVDARHGDDMVVYFLCKTIKAHYDLGQMIMSGLCTTSLLWLLSLWQVQLSMSMSELMSSISDCHVSLLHNSKVC